MNQNNNMECMNVLKRDGTNEEVSFDKVLRRIKNLSDGLNVNPTLISQKICSQIYNEIKTSMMDELGAEECASLSTEHPDYGKLSSRIIISNHHKNTSPSFSETISILYNNYDIHNKHCPLVSKDLYDIVNLHKLKLNDVINSDRDFNLDYFGYKTLERAYLLKVKGVVIERPQYMYMRVALGIHNLDIKDAIETYNLMSEGYFIHATPTLFNAGTPRPQLSSCFLLPMESDSIEGIYNTLKSCALISQSAGGIGLWVHNIRAKGSIIRGTNGISNGLTPMLRVFNNTARYVDQGGGKRNGSIAIYLEPWHADIEDFLLLKKNFGNEEERCRDLFYALWICDLFMKRVKEEGDWTLMCPDECRGLQDAHGDEFEKLYLKYESEGKGKKTIKARDLWFSILESQIETGVPYILFKDACNRKSNQQNLGTIKSSNLCTEIVEYSSPDEYAVCNLASIGLPKYIKNGEFDYGLLRNVVKIITKNLNKVIDINYYPVPQTETSNKRHRPVGIGVQGLADVFAILKLPFDSDGAKEVNRKIFENIYYASLEMSMEISKKREIKIKRYNELKSHVTEEERKEFELLTQELKLIPEELNRTEYLGSYSSFIGSPSYHGKLQYDLWNITPSTDLDWDGLKENIKRYGIRNSLLLAPMPTASTSQILGNNEAIEPFTSNMYLRRTLAGEYILVNKYLIKDLIEINMWNKNIKDQIVLNYGSVQSLDIPQEMKDRYKTVWEIKQRHLIDMSADRGAFICQSQSLNLFIESPDYKKLSSMHFYSWQKGLKTGIYYLRTKPQAKAQQFTIDPNLKKKTPEVKACLLNDPTCEACGS
jgi:ribonucleotide reductase alpha subunit